MSRVLAAAVFGLILTAGAPVGAQAPVPTAAAPSPLSAADQATVAQAVRYLEGLRTVSGRFAQSDGRGGEQTGRFHLQRPGKARFDYDMPAGRSITSDGHQVQVVDTRLKTLQAYPLGVTPLGLFLARDIRLDQGVRIVSVRHAEDQVEITAADARGRSSGTITLRFTETPFALTGWRIQDARGGVSVNLLSLAPASARDLGFFTLADPRPGRAPQDP